jgi:hypothetical protein
MRQATKDVNILIVCLGIILLAYIYEGVYYTMTKKNQEVATVIENAIEMPKALTPAPVIGVNTKVDFPEEMLPKELQGVTLETLETGFAPTVKWDKPGNFIVGVFEGVESKVGPNSANLYSFDARGKKFGVWGSTVLDRAMLTAMKLGQLQPGNMVFIAFTGTVPSDHEGNDTKLFSVKIVRK